MWVINQIITWDKGGYPKSPWLFQYYVMVIHDLDDWKYPYFRNPQINKSWLHNWNNPPRNFTMW